MSGYTSYPCIIYARLMIEWGLSTRMKRGICSVGRNGWQARE